MQGRSLGPLLRGASPSDWRDAVFARCQNDTMIRTRRWKLVLYDGEPGELFDLGEDPSEFRNRLADPACAEVVASLLRRVRAWEHDCAERSSQPPAV